MPITTDGKSNLIDNETSDILEKVEKYLKEEQKHLNRSTPQITESEISNTQDNWWEKEQTTSKTEFKIEKLVTFSKKSIYVMHFINFDGKENVLLRLLVQIVKFYMNYILQ